MADEDEDLTHLRAPDAAEIDLTDETQDFRFLDKLVATDNASLTLPKRGEKDFESHATNLQLETLEASRNAMEAVLSWPRTHTAKNHLLALYDPDSNMAVIEKIKSQHFQTMGASKGGREWLLPEEALFLIERGTLDCRWPVRREEGDDTEYTVEDGPPMSLQAAYAAFIGYEEGVGGKLTLEMYNVYAGLKRSGYIVFRTGTWNEDRGPLVSPAEKPEGPATASPNALTRFFTAIWRRISQPTHTITPAMLFSGPLIKPGLYRSYSDIYRLFHLIPSHTSKTPPSLILPASSSNPFRIHFDVHRSTPGFRKSARPTPDFRICVVNARAHSVPTGAELNDLLAQVPDDPSATGKEGEHVNQKLKRGGRNVVLAVVDNGIPSYLRIADGVFGEVGVFERPIRGGKGKGGRGRGGRGRGRGRGRGG